MCTKCRIFGVLFIRVVERFTSSNTPNDIVNFVVCCMLRLVSFLHSGMLVHDIVRLGADADTMVHFSMVIPQALALDFQTGSKA